MLHVCFSEGEYKKLLLGCASFKTTDRFCYLADDLSFGEIQNITDTGNREHIIQEFTGNLSFGFAENEALIHKYISQSNEVCIWYDNSPRDSCGYFYIVSNFNFPCTKFFAINCSQAIQTDNSVCQGFLETLSINYIPLYFSRRNEILEIKKDEIRNRWSNLVSENSLLRISQENKICSAPVCFYDPYILQFTSEVPAQVAHVLGLTLSYLSRAQRTTVSDGFLAMRVKKLIKEKILVQTKAGSTFYENFIQKSYS